MKSPARLWRRARSHYRSHSKDDSAALVHSVLPATLLHALRVGTDPLTISTLTIHLDQPTIWI